MKASERLERLEALCVERGVKLVYDDLQGEGGLCRLRERWYLIVNRRLSIESRVRLIHRALERVPFRAAQATPVAAEEPDEAVVRAAVRSQDKSDGRS